MKRVLTTEDVVAALQEVGEALSAQAEALRELDAAIGDGDLGITVTLGFQAVGETLPTLATSDISTILMRSGMAFNRKAASTFGALFATMMMRAAKEAKGLDQIDTPALARMVVAAAEGVMERGKAELGDKTLLDALVPAGEALTAAADKGASLDEALTLATAAAENGMLATTGMKSKMGRSSWFADRTVGIQDPGATAVTMMFRALKEFVSS